MAQSIYIDAIERAYTVRLFDGEEVTSSAETGTVNVGRIEIDDPDGSLDIPPLKAAYVVEDDAPAGNQRVWTGYLFNLTVDRGPYRSGAGRVWHADCVDVNFDLSRRFFISANAFRPAETDVERVDWILNGNLATVDLVFEGSLTNLTDNVKNLDADDLRYVTPMEALANIAPQCGKRAFAFYNETTDKVELFYDLADAAIYTSSASISNDIADSGAGVYFPYVDASLDRKGEEIASTWILNYVGGHERQDRADTLSAYGEHWFTSESSRIGRAATAATWVSQTLEAHSKPQDTITVTIETETADVNDIKEGQRVQIKFTHLPDLSAFVYRRVISRVLKRIPGGRLGKYLVQLVLDNATGTAIGGGGTGGFPHSTGCTGGTAALVQSTYAEGLTGAIATLGATPIPGNTVVILEAVRLGSGSPTPPTGFTASPAGTTLAHEEAITAYSRVVQLGDGTSYDTGSRPGPTQIWVEERAGSLEFDAASDGAASADPNASTHFVGPTITPVAGATAVVYGLFGWKQTGGVPTGTPDGGWTEAADANFSVNSIYVETIDVPSTSGSYTAGLTNASVVYDNHSYAGQTLVLSCTANNEPPSPGQWVYGEVITMSGATGTTRFPYAAGSLIVRVDGVVITRASYTETDNTTGDLTLSWTPDPDEVVTVDYQGL